MIYKIPEIRFQPFDKEWEKRNLSEIVKRVSDKSNAAILPRVEFEDIVSNEGRLKTDITNKVDARKGIHFHPGYILYGKLRPYLNNWLFPDFEGIALGDFWVFKTLYGIPAFNYYLIQSDRYQKVANLSSGTKMPRSDWGTVSSTQFYIPGTMEEQLKISEFLKHFDKLIELNQHALNHLKKRKKAFLQKMFPEKGEEIPEIRFPEFIDRWKERTLGECLGERKERSGNGELLSVTINSGVLKTSSLDRKDGSSENKSNYKKVEPGDIAYNSMRMWQGASGKSDFAGIVSPAYTVLTPYDETSTLFFSYLFKLSRMIYIFQANSQGLTSDTWNLKYPLLKDIKVYIPSYEEQQKIGNFFKELDNSITLQEEKLDSLKQMKKAFLQKMFF